MFAVKPKWSKDRRVILLVFFSGWEKGSLYRQLREHFYFEKAPKFLLLFMRSLWYSKKLLFDAIRILIIWPWLFFFGKLILGKSKKIDPKYSLLKNTKSWNFALRHFLRLTDCRKIRSPDRYFFYYFFFFFLQIYYNCFYEPPSLHHLENTKS